MLRVSLSALTAAVSIAASAAHADLVPIQGLFNTGATAAMGAQDPNWTVLETGAAAVVRSNIPNTYLPNTADSKWIWESANGQPGNNTRTFRLTFDLTGLVAGTAQISGRWSTDNVGQAILINGVSTGQSANGFTAWTNFSVNSGFVAGVNTIDFVVRDLGFPGGFRAELSGTAQAVPAPGAMALLGAVGLASRRRRR